MRVNLPGERLQEIIRRRDKCKCKLCQNEVELLKEYSLYKNNIDFEDFKKLRKENGKS